MAKLNSKKITIIAIIVMALFYLPVLIFKQPLLLRNSEDNFPYAVFFIGAYFFLLCVFGPISMAINKVKPFLYLMLALILSVTWGPCLKMWLNMKWDTSNSQVLATKIEEKKIVHSKNRSALIVMFHLPKFGKAYYRFSAPYKFYESVSVGDTIELKIKRGYFNTPYIETYQKISPI